MPVFRSPITIAEHATPPTPASGLGVIYPKSDGNWYTQNDAGKEAQIGPVSVTKTADQSITGAAGDVTDMGLSLAADSTYLVRFFVPIGTSTGISPTLTFSFTGPASPTMVSLRRSQFTGPTALAVSVITSFTAFASGGSVPNVLHEISGIVVTSSGNSGTMQLRAAAGGTNPAIQILAGSSAYALKVA